MVMALFERSSRSFQELGAQGHGPMAETLRRRNDKPPRLAHTRGFWASTHFPPHSGSAYHLSPYQIDRFPIPQQNMTSIEEDASASNALASSPTGSPAGSRSKPIYRLEPRSTAHSDAWIRVMEDAIVSYEPGCDDDDTLYKCTQHFTIVPSFLSLFLREILLLLDPVEMKRGS
jgi:hypothetical protein